MPPGTDGEPGLTETPLVPQAIRDAQRWRVYRLIEGKKPPVAPGTGQPLSGWQKTENDLTFDEAVGALAANPELDGLGFRLGDGWGGIDLDACRDLVTGELDPRAQAVLDLCAGAYAEVSPSGLGVKVFGRAAYWIELTFRKDHVDVRKSESGYFTVTGRALFEGGGVLEDLPLEAVAQYFGRQFARADEVSPDAPKKLPDVVVPGTQNSTLFAEMCGLRRRGYTSQEISAAAWAMVQGGRFPAEAGRGGWTKREVDQMAERVASRYPAGEDDFERDKAGKILPSPANVRRAFRALGVRPRLDRFAHQAMIEREGRSVALDDEVMRRLWFECNEALKWLPPRSLFHEVAADMAATDDYHPVRDYLDTLVWDGTPRLEGWLARYGGADDTPYTRAVGRLFLVAAVRRVRQPGAKFDELLVLESGQGLEKSNAVRRLCPSPEWFSESLVLASDSKTVIERTAGIWIAEAAELVGNHRQVDQLKAFLSTSVDGPVRLAYAREPVKVPRQFVVIGTTNHAAYLRDLTGGRRFWPVTVKRFDVAAIERDRDQLWAEAQAIEAEGQPIRLDPSLWGAAAQQQEGRRVEDPWEEALVEAFENGDGLVSSRDAWRVVGVPMERRTQADNERLGAVMRHLGFVRATFRDRTTRVVVKGYRRGTQAADVLPQLRADQVDDEAPL